MQPLLQSLNTASASAAGALLSAVWQGALLALAAALCLRLLPGLTATLRSFLWTAVLLIATALHLRPLLTSTSAAAVTAAGSTRGIHSARGIHIDSRWALALVATWAVLSLLRLLALARSANRLRQIALRSTPVAVEPACLPLLHHGHRHVELCTSVEVDRPCVLGFLSPRILLPPELLATLQTPELTHVLLHEMEHLRRGDHWLNLFQKLVLALSPLNPVLVWVERRLCLERELACDDGVLRFTRARKVYATCLTNLAEHALVRRSLVRRSLSLALGAWEKQSELTQRVQRILSLPKLAMGRTRAAVVSVALLGGLTAGATVLARSPQLITFTPLPQQVASSLPVSSPSAHLVLASRQSQNAQASFVQTRFQVPRTATLTRLPTVKRTASAQRLKAHIRRVSSRPPAQLTLTSFPGDGRRSHVVYTALPNAQFTYAAVPWLNGWIIVQL